MSGPGPQAIEGITRVLQVHRRSAGTDTSPRRGVLRNVFIGTHVCRPTARSPSPIRAERSSVPRCEIDTSDAGGVEGGGCAEEGDLVITVIFLTC